MLLRCLWDAAGLGPEGCAAMALWLVSGLLGEWGAAGGAWGSEMGILRPKLGGCCHRAGMWGWKWGWGQKWGSGAGNGVWGWKWGLLAERWGRGLGFGLRTPRFGVGIFGVCGFCVPGSWVFWGHFGGRDPQDFGVADPPPPPEVQLKPRQQPFRLRRQWAELVLRLSDAPPGAVARGKAGGHGGGVGGGGRSGGGLAWGSHPMGSGPLLGGRRPCWETSLWVWGRGLTPCPPPQLR